MVFTFPSYLPAGDPAQLGVEDLNQYAGSLHVARTEGRHELSYIGRGGLICHVFRL